ncbi:hypothetical protein B0H11DRAFT_2430367 [Mycena galericulata]|nr:hypothetical protein B0H11DRAFT_2430367 [Mycena galericulata]
MQGRADPAKTDQDSVLTPSIPHIAPIDRHSSDSPRGKVRQNAPVVVKALTRSASPEEYSPQPSPTTAQPAPIVLSQYRLATASSTSHICSRCSTPSPIIISTQPPTQRSVHLTLRQRSRSRSRGGRRMPPPVITAGPSVVIQAGPHTPHPMSPPIGSLRLVQVSRCSRSRSPQSHAPPVPRDIVQRHERSLSFAHLLPSLSLSFSFESSESLSLRPFAPPVTRVTIGMHHLEYGMPSTHSVSLALFFFAHIHELAFPLTPTTTPPSLSLPAYAALTAGLAVYTSSGGSTPRCTPPTAPLASSSGSCTPSSAGSPSPSAFPPHSPASSTSQSWVLRTPSSVRVPLTLIPLALLAVNHPQPVDDCPCFEDAIAVGSVVLGMLVGRWGGYVPGRGAVMLGSGWVLAAGAVGWAPVERGWGDVGVWWGAAREWDQCGCGEGPGANASQAKAVEAARGGAQNELVPADVDAEDEAMASGGREVKHYDADVLTKLIVYARAYLAAYADPSITTGLFFLDLLEAIRPGIVDPTLVLNVNENGDYKDWRQNAKLAISIARKMNTLIFLVPDDIGMYGRVSHVLILFNLDLRRELDEHLSVVVDVWPQVLVRGTLFTCETE